MSYPLKVTNVCFKDDGVIPVPIGVKKVFKSIGNTGEFLCLYCARNNTQERIDLHLKMMGEKWCTDLDERTPFNDYIQALSKHKFTISPEGAGYDCFRTWEALYCGSYPIVKRRYFTEYFAKELPIVLIDEWEEVTEEFLNTKYDEFKTKKWNFELLTEEYWKEKVCR